MKKNKMMRIASILMVATLITTCAISGTFAKYVTKASGEDKARVAKWGIVLDISGSSVFADKYAATDAKYLEAGGVNSVVSSVEGEKVVAPGTNAKEANGQLVAHVKGTPEVATRYTLVVDKAQDVVLPAGTYTDYTELVLKNGEYGYFNTFTLDKAYAPIKWDLAIAKGTAITADNPGTSLAATLWTAFADKQTTLTNYGFSADGVSIYDAVEIIKKVAGNDGYVKLVDKALSNVVKGGRNFQLNVDATTGKIELSYDFDANKDMDFYFGLDWEWAFEQENVELYDKADTFLGNWAAVKFGQQQIAGFVEPAAPASVEINATFTATATQID